jgi:hypothetical protein
MKIDINQIITEQDILNATELIDTMILFADEPDIQEMVLLGEKEDFQFEDKPWN